MSSLLRPRTATAALVLILAACSTAATPAPSTPEPVASAEPTESPSPSAEPTQTEAATPSQTEGDGAPSGFTVEPHPDADALFLDRDDCENLEDGYRLEFPEEWYTNTEIGDVSACSWFSAEFFEVEYPTQIPDEIAITI